MKFIFLVSVCPFFLLSGLAFSQSRQPDPQQPQNQLKQPAPDGDFIDAETEPQQPQNQLKQPKPKFKASVSALYAEKPHYPGSNEYNKSFLILPTFSYESEHIKIGFPFLEFYSKNSRLEWSVNFSPSLPTKVSSIDSPRPKNYDQKGAELKRSEVYRRRGMNTLPALLNTTFAVGYDLDFLFFRLAHTQINSFGEGFYNVGGKTIPSAGLTFGYPFQISDDELLVISILSYSQEFGNRTHNQNYYGVSSEEVISNEREFYKAEAGLIQEILTFNLIFEYDRWTFLFGVSSSNMENSALKNSPLVINNKNTLRSVNLSYQFYEF